MGYSPCRAIARAPLEKRDCNLLHRICQQIDFYAQVAEQRAKPDND
jgi:hypothetical protein